MTHHDYALGDGLSEHLEEVTVGVLTLQMHRVDDQSRQAIQIAWGRAENE